MTKSRVVVGLSGGVDSAVAAWLLKEAGHEVVGIFMKNWEDDDTDEYCTSREDLVDAVSVADVIGIDVESVNFAREYKDRVFQSFLTEYQAGRTPNPDVLCNSEIKFRSFLDHALALGADHIATGHYAGVRAGDPGRVELLKARDRSKDQSYFLYRLDQTQLSRSLFPLHGWLKKDVRALAGRIGLPNHAKKDSTGICFIGERPFREFLERYLPRNPGDMVTPDGRVVGRHAGLMYYTIGQRQGLGIGGQGLPWYVAAKDLAGNRLVVVQGHDHPALQARALRAGDCTWVAGAPPAPGESLGAKTRYRQSDARCHVTEIAPDGVVTVHFDEAQWAVTPGQSLVLYRDDVCLGGGIILGAVEANADRPLERTSAVSA
ncbi:MAG: tRNA 2-thiouridine(34) synthase MnmA [Betaproteobacteria bacterium]|nr:tRNA 2-thiouridine(34) synthase MnmA [Betaproteobacteria bacterium]